MKKLLAALWVVVATSACVGQADGGYPILVHVQSSENYQYVKDFNWLRLHVTIDGKKYVLEKDHYRKNVLHIGDYRAKVLRENVSKSYEYSRVYEFLLPDGEKRKFVVVGESE